MYYSKVEICGVNTSDLKTLNDEEKRELLIKAKNGDNLARQELIDGNLRLVLSIVQRFVNRGENPDDLFQVGCIGLIKAVDNFNTELDVKFSTYAVPMIIGEIRRYLRDNNIIRVSRSMRDLAYSALTAKEVLSKQMNRDPDIADIVKYLKDNSVECTTEKVVAALEAIVDPVSLFEPVFNDTGTGDSLYVMDQISDLNSNDECWLESIALSEAMKKLNEREKNIILMRFFEGKTQMEIADEIGISQAQVSRLEKGAIETIRKDFV
ncbi:MAG: RNA polymerase sporulation sigma factor SigG [Ruminococcaceae bacterium]|nr:RNA polymerase sporulation sigma factor SigG [Oscillospiraceae bacterium]